MTRRTRILLGVLAVAVGAGAWFVVQRGVRLWWWDGMALRALTPEEEREADACGEPGWWTLVKVLAQDRDSACGEDWVVRTVAREVRGGDKAAWLTERVADPSQPAGLRLRGALALAVAGRPSPTEAAWLRTAVGNARRSATRAVGRDPELAVHLGPAGMALGMADRAAAGELEAEEALPALRWLALLGEPEAEEAVGRAVDALHVVDDRAFDGERSRRQRELPPLAALIDALEGSAPPPGSDVVLGEVLEGLGVSAAERPGWEWSLGALRAWLAPAPEERLRSLWARPATGPLVRFAWDGGGPPFGAAVLVSRARAETRVRADRPGAVWLEAGEWVARGCGEAGLEPPAEDWPLRALIARAWLERGEAGRAARVDPLVAAPPPTGDPVAFALGAALAPGAPLAGAEADRSRLTAADLTWCR